MKNLNTFLIVLVASFSVEQAFSQTPRLSQAPASSPLAPAATAPAAPAASASDGLCIDDDDQSEACRELRFDDLARDIDAIEARNEQRRQAEALREQQLQQNPPATPPAPRPITNLPVSSGLVPSGTTNLPPTALPSPARPGNSSDQMMTFGDELVSGAVERPDSPSRVRRQHVTALQCYDQRIAPVFESFRRQNRSTLTVGDRTRVRVAYRQMLQCFYSCASEMDANFLMECSGVNRFINEINAPSDLMRRLGSLPVAQNGNSAGTPVETPWCSVEALMDGYRRHQFTARMSQNSQCVPLVSGTEPQEHQEVVSLFNGLDIAVMMDNSESMMSLGPAFATEMFPEFVRATAQLPIEARLILFTQNYSGSGFRFDESQNPYVPFALSTRAPNLMELSEQYVRLMYGMSGDGDERHTRSSVEHLSSTMRPNADLFLIIVTDEDDCKDPMAPDEFLRQIRNITQGQVRVTVVASLHDVNDCRIPGGQLDALVRQPGLIGERIEVDVTAFRSRLLSRLAELTAPPESRWIPITLQAPLDDDFEVRLNGRTLPFSAARKTGPNNLEISARNLNPRVPTQLTVVSHGAPRPQPLSEAEQRDWITRYLGSLLSTPSATPPISPTTVARQTNARRVREAAGRLVNTFNERAEEFFSPENAAEILNSWNGLEVAVLSEALGQIPDENMSQFISKVDQALVPLLQWVLPLPFSSDSATQSRSDCRADAASLSQRFHELLRRSQTQQPNLRVVQQAIALLVNARLAERIFYCESLSSTSAESQSTAVTATTGGVAPRPSNR